MLAKDEVQRLVESHDWAALRESLRPFHISEVADVLSEVGKTERVLVFRSLPRQMAAAVFAYLEPFEQDALLRDLTDEETRHILANLAPDDRTELLEELPSEVTQRLLGLLSPEDLKEARQLLGYPEDSVGRLMTPDYLAVKSEWTVNRALEEMRSAAAAPETANALYVTDSSSRLTGVVALRQLVLGDPDAVIESIMRTPPVSISAFDDQARAAEVMERYDLSVLPVLDSNGAMVGIVTADDVLEMAHDETTEDFHKAAAVSPLRISYKDAGVGLLYRNRVTWLVGLVLIYLLSGEIMAHFEGTIAAVVPLVFFLPLLIDSAGNAGSQSAVLMVRALGTGDAGLRDWAALLFRELGVSGALGLLMGAAAWGLGTLRAGLEVGLVVGLSMLLVVIVTCLFGICVPVVLSKLGFDPATASSPMVTSVADILGVLVYFSIATWYLHV